MYLDISSNQGKIDWKTLAENNRGLINGVILRATTQNNKLDVRAMENYNGILHNMSDIDEISVYKFSYARDYASARVECAKCLSELAAHGIHFDFFYLDLEGWSGRDYSREEANAVILGYIDGLKAIHPNKFRLYFNYNYLKNIIDPYWHSIPIWLARYNATMGDLFGANVVLWQYTSTGKIDGISGNVDLSREVI